MPNAAKTLELNLEDVRARLPDRAFAGGRDIFGNADIVARSNDDGFLRINGGSLLHVRHGVVLKPFRYVVVRSGRFTLQFIIEGDFTFRAERAVFRSRKGFVRVNTFERSVARFDDVGASLKGISITTSEEALQQYGLNRRHLSAIGKALFSSESRSSLSIEFPMSAPMTQIVDGILSCRFPAETRTPYLSALTEALLCHVVAIFSGPDATSIPTISPELRATQAAAMIYRTELSNPPSIEMLAERVGLNRNKLTDGFRQLYGLTPAAFSRKVRLEWACERLSEDMSIAAIAREVGYDAATFSRVFKTTFGKAPSAMTRDQNPENERPDRDPKPI